MKTLAVAALMTAASTLETPSYRVGAYKKAHS